MDQSWLLVGLLVEYLVGLLKLQVIVTALTVLAFVTDLNGFSMLAFTSGTKDIFRLILYLAPLFTDEKDFSVFDDKVFLNFLLPKPLFAGSETFSDKSKVRYPSSLGKV